MSGIYGPLQCGQASAKALDALPAKSRSTTCTATGKSYDQILGCCARADGADVNDRLVRNGDTINWPKYSGGRYASELAEGQTARGGG